MSTGIQKNYVHDVYSQRQQWYSSALVVRLTVYLKDKKTGTPTQTLCINGKRSTSGALYCI